MQWAMPLRSAAVLLVAAAVLTGCDSGHKKMSARDVQHLLEGSNGPKVVCTSGTEGWQYTCKTPHRKIGVTVHDNGTAELSNWTPIDESLTVGPGGESPDVRAHFVDEANDVCKQARSQILRLTPPVSRRDALSRLDQIRELRFIEVAQLEAIKPTVALAPDYTSMVAAIKAVGDDEMALRDALASGTPSTRRSALTDRRSDARLADEIALRLGLRGCIGAAMPLPGITR